MEGRVRLAPDGGTPGQREPQRYTPSAPGHSQVAEAVARAACPTPGAGGKQTEGLIFREGGCGPRPDRGGPVSPAYLPRENTWKTFWKLSLGAFEYRCWLPATSVRALYVSKAGGLGALGLTGRLHPTHHAADNSDLENQRLRRKAVRNLSSHTSSPTCRNRLSYHLPRNPLDAPQNENLLNHAHGKFNQFNAKYFFHFEIILDSQKFAKIGQSSHAQLSQPPPYITTEQESKRPDNSLHIAGPQRLPVTALPGPGSTWPSVCLPGPQVSQDPDTCEEHRSSLCRPCVVWSLLTAVR